MLSETAATAAAAAAGAAYEAELLASVALPMSHVQYNATSATSQKHTDLFFCCQSPEKAMYACMQRTE